jgi:hypothetical protein
MKKPLKKLIFFILINSLLISKISQAGEGAFGWIYSLDLQPKGTWEFEQKVDLTTKQATGTYSLWKTKSGIEYGVTNDFQITGYINGVSVHANKNYTNCDGASPCTAGWGVPGSASPNDPFSKTSFRGASLEGIWRVTNPVISPIGVGIYLEGSVGEFSNAIESRLLLQSNFLDDKLIVAANFVAEFEKYKWNDQPMDESILDILYGVSYRVAPKWFAGIEGRFHNDFVGYGYKSQTQKAHFIGPNIHYASKDWWTTVAFRYQLGGKCWAPGDVDCMNGKVADGHGQNQFIVKVGFPFH